MTLRRPSDVWADNQVTLDVGDTLTISGNVTVASITNPVALKGNLTIDSGTISTITNPVALKGNLTIDSGTISTITNPVALKGNLTIDSGIISTITNPVALKGNLTVDSGNISLKGNVTLSDSKGFIGLVSCASIQGTTNLSTLIAGEDQVNDVLKTEQQFSYWYSSGPTVDAIVKASAGFLHSVILGSAVASGSVEVSDHASDGDGAVKVFLSGNASIFPGPAVYPVNANFTTGITTDIINQTQVTIIYR